MIQPNTDLHTRPFSKNLSEISLGSTPRPKYYLSLAGALGETSGYENFYLSVIKYELPFTSLFFCPFPFVKLGGITRRGWTIRCSSRIDVVDGDYDRAITLSINP